MQKLQRNRTIVTKGAEQNTSYKTIEGCSRKAKEQQAGFRKDRSCTEQIAALRIIIEQSLEWNTSLFLNSVDF